ncbi:MAG TPA: lysophospholipid acyltransferase family protein [Acidisarcina sp.]
MIASLTLLTAYVVLSIPAAIVGLPWTLMTGDVSLLYRWAMWILRTSSRLAGLRVVVEGRELVPRGRACIFMTNHLSNLDPPLLLPQIPGRASVFLKRSLMKIPAVGMGMRLADFIPVDRDGRPESARESVRFAKTVLESGVSVLTFVEGTRSRTGQLQAFKKGPFFLAMESGVPVVPISIRGTEGMMKKGSLRIERGEGAHITFHAALNPADYSDREGLMRAVRSAMESALPEWMHTPESSSRAG